MVWGQGSGSRNFVSKAEKMRYNAFNDGVSVVGSVATAGSRYHKPIPFGGLMTTQDNEHSGHLVIVVGAGPAGMSVIDNLSKAGHYVIVLNRDIKFGGLAEYGIFPSKHKMKEGLRKRYREILARRNVEYYGNVPIGADKVLSLMDLQSLEPSGIIFAAGAQGTKSLGLEGEEAEGVFHAKELVYHYNGLPPFSARPVPMGEHVAVIGIGNVMVDIAHWLVRYLKVKEVTAIARRGPAERKYDEKEIRHVCANINQEAVRAEFERIRPRLIAAGEDPDKILADVLGEFTKGEPATSDTRMQFRFLSAPKRVLKDARGRVRAVELEDTCLDPGESGLVSHPLGTIYEFPCDSVVFAVGDRADEFLGLPYNNGIIVTAPVGAEDKTPSFQVYDEKTGRVLDGIFVVGWCRKASEGLVGIAKRDGDLCSEVVQHYLASRTPYTSTALAARVEALRSMIHTRRPEAVTKADIQSLESTEREIAQQRGLEAFKFHTNGEMLAAIRKTKDPLPQ